MLPWFGALLLYSALIWGRFIFSNSFLAFQKTGRKPCGLRNSGYIAMLAVVKDNSAVQFAKKKMKAALLCVVAAAGAMGPPPGPTDRAICPVKGVPINITSATPSVAFKHGQKLYFATKAILALAHGIAPGWPRWCPWPAGYAQPNGPVSE